MWLIQASLRKTMYSLNLCIIFLIISPKEKTKKNKFNNVENWEELEAQQQKLFELSRNFSLPPESLKKSNQELKEIEPKKSASTDLILEPKKPECLINVFEKPNEDDDYENFE